MKFHTQLKANDIFKFSLAYTYSGLQLILAIAMVAVGVYMCVTGMGAADGQSNMIFWNSFDRIICCSQSADVICKG